MAIDHKFVSVINKSSTNGIGNTDVNVFDSDNHASPDISYVADTTGANTFDSSTGEITIGDGGNYFVIFSCFIDSTTTSSDRNPTVKIKLDNSTVAQFRAYFEAASGAIRTNGMEVTTPYFGSISPGSKITATLVSDNATTDVFAETGTTLTVIKVGDSYAVATRIGGTTATAAEHNPFVTGTLNTHYTLQKSSDFSVTGASNNFKFDSPGNTKLFYLSANYYLSQSDTSNRSLTNRTYKNDAVVHNSVTQMIGSTTAGNNPYEVNAGILQQLSDTNTTRATILPATATLYALSSSAYSVFEVNDENYASVRTTGAAPNIASGSSDIILKSATPLVTANAITYDSANGTFTVGSSGYYFVSSNLIISSSANNFDVESVNFSLRKNASSCADGTTLNTSNCRVDGSGDPLETTLVGVYSLSANDSVSICAANNAISANGLGVLAGTTFTIFKVGSVGGGGGGGGPGGGTARITSFGSRSGGFSAGSFGSPTSGRTVGNGFF